MPTFYRYEIRGVVQGVGFRPYVYRIATTHGLKGYVRNTGSGVEVVVDHPRFWDLLENPPPLARIDECRLVEKEKGAYSSFSIRESGEKRGETLIPPDVAICEDCLRELYDRKNRRNGYYFITCTNCGPRFSIIEDYPYDRPNTSMREFPMCKECEKEYTDPGDRRYHAQTVACRDCGPRLFLYSNGKNITGSTDRETIERAARLVLDGELVSIKGVGGVHIASLTRPETVKKLRSLLGRRHKPFAVMVRDLEMAERIARVSPRERELLESPARPIVVLRKKKRNSLREVSELDTIGVMLPYTGLHYLLFDHIHEPIVMTSCNRPGEPVSLEEGLTPHFLSHERRIVNRCDDSVVKVVGGKSLFLRRSRGYVPLPVELPFPVRDTISVGAELNNAICISRGNRAFLSQYVGNTGKPATARFMEQAIQTITRLSRAKPERIVCDLHPSYSSTLLAEKLARKHGLELLRVQHHEAHIASVAGEHSLEECVGIAMDGMGYGRDGRIWGGEVLHMKNGVFERIGSLEEQPQLGGDSATRYPKKMLFGILSRFLDERELLSLGLFPEREALLYLGMLREGFNTPLTTSTGRVLDAASTLLGLCDERTYEGRPAMLLEANATGRPLDIEPVIERKDGRLVLSTTRLFEFLLENNDAPKERLASTVLEYIARGALEIARKKSREKIPIVASGGVVYNRVITKILLEHGVLTNQKVPAGDGGIAYGQAVVAGMLDL